jgi:hypothetical protein
MNPSTELPTEGTRLGYSGYLGTIRYVGTVNGTKGVWLGVEWDDPHRGKHDGVKDGKRYFTCRYGYTSSRFPPRCHFRPDRIPNAGSFIRPSASIIYGTSFLRALMSKYIEPLQGSASQEKVFLGSSKGSIEVEVVGLDKVRSRLANLQMIKEVSLDGENVARADPPGELSGSCPSELYMIVIYTCSHGRFLDLRGVDLSLSLLPSWDVVAAIASELPALERLALKFLIFFPHVAYSDGMLARTDSSPRRIFTTRARHF